MKKRLGLYLKLLAIILVTAFAAYLVLPNGGRINLKPLKINFDKTFKMQLGLDLQGGSHLEYQGDLTNIEEGQRREAMESVRSAIERRIFLFGVQEPLVETAGEDRIIVELPGITNIDEAIKVIGQTPFLEFREINEAALNVTPDENGQLSIDTDSQWKTTGLTGRELETATVQFGPSGQPEISLQFNSEGTKLFAEITQRNLGRPVAIFLDGAPLSTPTVQSAITTGQASITGQFTVQEAKELATRLNSGALPVPIKLISQQNVGATLGQESIHKSIIAGILGMLMVALFMLTYYRLPGLLAVIALCVYTILSLAIFKVGISISAIVLVGLFLLLALTVSWWFGVLAGLSYLAMMLLGGLNPITLTLAGIAGFILSIGMAVDANILIFERTKEELHNGKDVRSSLDDGFLRAWPSIRDSNVSSLITTFILYLFGTPSIKSFALALSIGIIVSMFTAITVTRTLTQVFIGRNIVKHPWLFGASRSAKGEKNA
jgi:preprotein translocase subunit SecD